MLSSLFFNTPHPWPLFFTYPADLSRPQLLSRVPSSTVLRTHRDLSPLPTRLLTLDVYRSLVGDPWSPRGYLRVLEYGTRWVSGLGPLIPTTYLLVFIVGHSVVLPRIPTSVSFEPLNVPNDTSFVVRLTFGFSHRLSFTQSFNLLYKVV